MGAHEAMGQGKGTIYGLLGEFESAAALVEGSRRVRREGYTRWDAHCPYPVHGLEGAMGLARSRVPWYVFILGMAGAAGGMLLQWWVSAEAYPLVISGKPLFSWPAFVPIMFETGVLGGAAGAVLGFLAEAKLPRPHHALFESERFERASDDAFFISIEASDPQFDLERTTGLLRQAGATAVEVVKAAEAENG